MRSFLYVVFLLCGAACSRGEHSKSVVHSDHSESQQLEYVEDAGFSEDVVVCVGDFQDQRLPLDVLERQALSRAGFTQCVMPFGILIAADSKMPKEYVRTAGAVLAEMLDQDMDGQPDDPRLVKVLRDRKRAWLAMPVDEDAWEDTQLPILNREFGYDIIIPSWWMGVKGSVPDTHARAVIVEEVHHFITQFGYSVVYPKVFGVDDWSSILGQETLRAQCAFWQHPENDCPGSPAEIRGDCSDPNCDAVEFFQQVIVLRAGMKPGWTGIGFPENAIQLEALLSDEFKSALDDPAFHQLHSPLTFGYPIRD